MTPGDVDGAADASRTELRWWCLECVAAGRPGGDLFELLQEVLPVRFVSGPPTAGGGAAGAGDAGGLARAAAASGSLTLCAGADAGLSLTLPACAAAAPLALTTVRFADDPLVPWPFRGRSVEVQAPAGAALDAPDPSERVLAWSGRAALWSAAPRGAGMRQRSAFALPEVGPSGTLSEVFHGARFLELLPLLHLLDQARGDARWHAAPLRAAFIVDDPNLHWPRYGCVDYRRFAERARRQRYHVAFATIPLDAWYTHAGTAALFRAHPEQLSLVVHGNDHTSDELARPRAREARRALLHQALRRIERMEARAGLQVGRVMVAPHGACSSDMLAELPTCGFESACISTGSLRAHNRSESWTRSAGLLPSEHVGGCAVLPRWGLRAGVSNALLLAAYLGQALIVCGHHRDCRDDLEAFGEAARFINGLGDVRWADLATLSRLNYQWRMDGTVLRLRPFGGRIAVDLPPEAARLVVDAHPRVGREGWELSREAPGLPSGARVGDGLPGTGRVDGPALRVSVARRVEPQGPLDGVDLPALSARFVLRRLLTETRDRLAVL